MHEKLAVWTRVAAVLAALAIGVLLVTIKADLASVARTLSTPPAHIALTHHEADMTTLTACLCSPTRGTIRIVTTSRPDESVASTDARHLAKIAEWKAQVADAVDCPCPD